MNIGYRRDEYFSRVDFLYDLSIQECNNRELLTNLIIIDIVTNMEVYIERLLKKFIKKYNELDVSSQKIKNELKIEHKKKVMCKVGKIIDHNHKQVDTVVQLEKLSKLWSQSSNDKVSIDIDLKFPKGRHGEAQLEALFNKVGMPSILEKVNILSSESLISQNKLDIQEFVRDITNKRNLAIHEGAPLHGQVSLENLKFFIDTTDELLCQITELVNNELKATNDNITQ